MLREIVRFRRVPIELLSLNKSSADTYIKSLADGCQLAVVSIGYRLAPEHPHPAGPNDCIDAAEWLIKKARPNYGAPLMFISGDVSHDLRPDAL